MSGTSLGATGGAEVTTDPTVGLRAGEIDARAERDGRVNHLPERTSRTYRGIVSSNVFTRFNTIISVLAAIVLLVGDPIDALFVVVMIVNATVGIVQEIRAKRTLDRVRILVTPTVLVRRDGVDAEIAPSRVVADDIITLRPGDQIPVDGVVLQTDVLEVDESALTGESDSVPKREGDEVLSSSSVLAGTALIVATRVGDQAWVHRLVEQAKEYSLATSELRTGVDQILRVVSWIIGPLAALLVWSQLRANNSTEDGLISAVAGVVGLVPQGLVLLVSMALAVAVIRLARDHVVVQELHAVEGLARVDTFCVDKTGTLTTGKMQVERIEPIDATSELVRQALTSLAASDQTPTSTMDVIAAKVAGPTNWPAVHHEPFSSARKWSGATFDNGRDELTWVLGAPEFLLDGVDEATRRALLDRIGQSAASARRVVLLASSTDPLGDQVLPDVLTPRALVILSEVVRPDAGETMEFFRRENVNVKVISGDSVDTVSAVAAQIGLPGADRNLDMRTVEVDDIAGMPERIDETVVFGRVSPEQKRAIVETLQASGHTVAMTGDGVNDIPALKRADIGVAIDTATAATKAISQLVLLDGRFDRMPHVVAEGRRVVANMERVSTLFVTKTVYSAIFALAIGLSGSVFPFLPRHMSLVSTITIGLPAFALSFRANDQPCRPGYLPRVMAFAVPAGVGAAVVTLIAYWVTRSPLASATLDESRSASTLALIVFGLWVVDVLMRPLDRFDAALLAVLVVMTIGAFALGPVSEFFRLGLPEPKVALLVGAIVLVGVLVAQFALQVSTRHPTTVTDGVRHHP